MAATGKTFQVITAGGGFFAGYLWGVGRWAARVDPGSESLVRSALLPGALLAAVYTALLGTLFWSWIPTPGTSGLRAVVSPVAFTLSLLAGALGIRWAFWMLG